MELLVNHLKATQSKTNLDVPLLESTISTTQSCVNSVTVILPKLEMDCIPLQINNPHPSSRSTLEFGHHLFWTLGERTMVADNGLTLYT